MSENVHISGGPAGHLDIEDAEGRTIHGVKTVDLHPVDPGDVVTVDLTLVGVKIDIEAELNSLEVECLDCGTKMQASKIQGLRCVECGELLIMGQAE